jgi:hypothetical protein
VFTSQHAKTAENAKGEQIAALVSLAQKQGVKRFTQNKSALMVLFYFLSTVRCALLKQNTIHQMETANHALTKEAWSITLPTEKN